MADEIKELRRELGRIRGGREKRYPEVVKRRVGEWAVEQRVKGMSWSQIARELGIAQDTLLRWARAQSGAEATPKVKRAVGRASLVPVRVVETAASSHGHPPSLVSVAGWKIEGLSLAEAASMLRELR